MAQINSNLNLYKTPSDEILRKRKEFYNLWRRCDDQPTIWMHRAQNQMNRCDFPPFMSREYLLIDKFVCQLNDNERKFIQSVNTWTLTELIEYFGGQKLIANETSTANTAHIDQNQQQPTSTIIMTNCEFVSKPQTSFLNHNSMLYHTCYFRRMRCIHEILHSVKWGM